MITGTLRTSVDVFVLVYRYIHNGVPSPSSL